MDVDRFYVSNESAVVLNGSQYCRFDHVLKKVLIRDFVGTLVIASHRPVKTPTHIHRSFGAFAGLKSAFLLCLW